MAHLLTTVPRARRKRALSRQSTDVVSDFLYAASAWLEKRLGYDVATASHTEILDGNGLDRIWLRHTPITAITSVTMEDDDGTSHSLTVATDVVYDAATGRLLIGPDNVSDYDVFPKGLRNVTVVYTAGHNAAGYDGGNAPDDIQEAVILKALCLYAESSTYQNAAFRSESLGEHSAERITSDDLARWNIQLNDILQRYERMEV